MGLILILSLVWCCGLWLSQPVRAAEPDEQALVLSQQLPELRRALNEGQAQLAGQVEAIDDAPAQAWLQAGLAAQATKQLEGENLAEAARQLWQQVLDNERSAEARLSGALERAELAHSADERLDQARRQLDELAGLLTGEGRSQSLTQVEDDIAELKARQSLLLSEVEQKQQALARLEEEQRGQQQALETLRRQAPEEAAPAVQAESTPELAEAREALQSSVQRRTDARQLAAELDGQTIPVRQALLQLEIRALALANQLLNLHIQQREGEFNRRSSEELRALSVELHRLAEREPEAQTRFAAELETLRGHIDGVATAYEQLRLMQQRRDDYGERETRLTQTLESIRERLDIGGLTEALGVQFLDEKRRLNEYKEPRFSLQVLERDLAQSRLRSISLRDQLRELAGQPRPPSDDPAQGELHRIKTQILTLQLQAEEQLSEQLRQNEVRLRELNRLVAELDQTLSESLLWWPSHATIGAGWLKQVPDATLSLLSPGNWLPLLKLLLLVLVASPFNTALALLTTVLLVFWGRNTREQLTLLAEQSSHRYTDNIGLTFKAIGWSLLRVLPVPLLLLLAASQLATLADAEPVAEVLAGALGNIALWWLAGHLFLLFVREHGPGNAHFNWHPLLLARLGTILSWFLPAQLLLLLGLALSFSHPDEAVYDVFGRLILLLITGLNGLATWRLLAPGSRHETAFVSDGKRRFIRIGMSLLFAILGLLILGGYLITVAELLPRFVDSLVVLSLVWLAYSLAARALILSETHLLLRRKREQRAKTAEEGNSMGEGNVELPDPHLSLEDINQQTRTLLRTATLTLLAVALFWVWAEVLPALTWLDGVTLWSRTITVGESEVLSAVSLQDFLLAIFLGTVYLLAARNLPGLVEILLARSSLMDAAHSYTVTTLLRYALAVMAVITVFSLLGLRWSELQWMVAALTLGLGFGLQEVVANFVSGIIMLFERPVRVGDTITIGEFSGTVARIRTRATTIIDWDNREIVVPNKAFITERLINWTLSDNVTRIVIKVGVSYDADVDQAKALLEQIAEAHPLTLEEPPPSVFFTLFGASTLDFELRAYVDKMNDRMVTTSELNFAILKAFRQAGIEIAFPQMDLHIRHLPREAPAAGRDAAE
ncbi:mechanosensitive ion channel protein MscS [Zobellella endophytica]|uniref:Mechanosensitive ion channel protein MscS n=1 Tax=Zobellella endophytica TaxID=2116700 RepID=A0A2P7R675_9GAMM|nr:mechanosensitive ion channel protein MscS [Zobellella endophytica]